MNNYYLVSVTSSYYSHITEYNICQERLVKFIENRLHENESLTMDDYYLIGDFTEKTSVKPGGFIQTEKYLIVKLGNEIKSKV